VNSISLLFVSLTNGGSSSAIFVCPTYYLLNAFKDRAYRVCRGCDLETSLNQLFSCRRASLPFLRPFTVSILPTTGLGEPPLRIYTTFLLSWHISISVGFSVTYNNTEFVDAFAQSFISFAISLDPNVKIDPTITPQWDLYSTYNGEMLFNRTADGKPDVRLVKTDDGLLQRCR